MGKTFKGRPVIAGSIVGETLVTHRGFNTLASFYKSLLTGAPTAVCGDQNNPDLYGKNLTDKIICLPKAVGSTSAGPTWDRVAYLGIAPQALLFSRDIDSLTAAGLVIADVWVGRQICAVDRLGDAFLAYVKEGSRVIVCQDGTVVVD